MGGKRPSLSGVPVWGCGLGEGAASRALSPFCVSASSASSGDAPLEPELFIHVACSLGSQKHALSTGDGGLGASAASPPLLGAPNEALRLTETPGRPASSPRARPGSAPGPRPPGRRALQSGGPPARAGPALRGSGCAPRPAGSDAPGPSGGGAGPRHPCCGRRSGPAPRAPPPPAAQRTLAGLRDPLPFQGSARLGRRRPESALWGPWTLR